MYAGIFGNFFDHLSEWSSHWWFLLVILAIAFLDSVIPIVPSETTVIIGGVAAGSAEHHQHLALVILMGAVGAFLGDNAAYSIGRHFAPRFERRAARRPKFGRRLTWANEQIQERGGLLLITARFIPGGRTALTLASGITRQSRFWFIRWIIVAATIWATYAASLGYIGGKAFEDNHTVAFLVAFGLALSINFVIEIIRHRRKKRQEAAFTSG
jgi:membrane protein DedA with SNARE-associated domain